MGLVFFLRALGWMEDPNFAGGEEKLYKLRAEMTESELTSHLETYRMKIVPLSKDLRPEAAALFANMNLV